MPRCRCSATYTFKILKSAPCTSASKCKHAPFTSNLHLFSTWIIDKMYAFSVIFIDEIVNWSWTVVFCSVYAYFWTIHGKNRYENIFSDEFWFFFQLNCTFILIFPKNAPFWGACLRCISLKKYTFLPKNPEKYTAPRCTPKFTCT